MKLIAFNILIINIFHKLAVLFPRTERCSRSEKKSPEGFCNVRTRFMKGHLQICRTCTVAAVEFEFQCPYTQHYFHFWLGNDLHKFLALISTREKINWMGFSAAAVAAVCFGVVFPIMHASWSGDSRMRADCGKVSRRDSVLIESKRAPIAARNV